MKKIALFASLVLVIAFCMTSRAWAVACPVGGPIYHGSGQAGAAIAECSERIKKAQAAGRKLPNPEAWRASNPCAGISNCSPYPLSWSSASAKANIAEAKPAQARNTAQATSTDAAAAKRARPEPASSPPPAKKSNTAQPATTTDSPVGPTIKPSPTIVASNTTATPPRTDEARLSNVQDGQKVEKLSLEAKTTLQPTPPPVGSSTTPAPARTDEVCVFRGIVSTDFTAS